MPDDCNKLEICLKKEYAERDLLQLEKGRKTVYTGYYKDECIDCDGRLNCEDYEPFFRESKPRKNVLNPEELE